MWLSAFRHVDVTGYTMMPLALAAAGPLSVLRAHRADDPTSGQLLQAVPRVRRLASVDAYRGLVMVLMLAEVFRSCDVSAALPGSRFWTAVCRQQTHAAWVGMSLHDFIQPSFYFLVGLVVLLSWSRRLSSGQSWQTLAAHTASRALALIFLGMFLLHPHRWEWSFVDTLTQIGLAYPIVVFIASRPRRAWYVALGAILVGYWTWFAFSAPPPPYSDYGAVSLSPEWLNVHGLSGFQAHWQKNSNVSWAFDHWFLNLFPRDSPHMGEADGLTTLNFIPSIGTMILGLFAGEVLLSARTHAKKIGVLCTTGVLLVTGGWLLGALGICPIVKAIWTPSWVLFSGGWCFLTLAAFSALIDDLGLARLAFPLRIVGMNSLMAYSLSRIYPAFAFNSIRRVVGTRVFQALGNAYEPMLYGGAIFLAYWLFLYICYHRRIFVRL